MANRSSSTAPTTAPGTPPRPSTPGATPAVASTYYEVALFLLRVMCALMLLQHGLRDVFGVLLPPPGTPGGPAGPETPFTRSWTAAALQLVLTPLLAAGLFTRPVAFLLSGVMASAYFLVHAPRSFYPIINRGELAALYCFVLFYLSARGGGRYSLDAWLRHKRSAISDQRSG